MFQFTTYLAALIMNSLKRNLGLLGWVSPFGNLRIIAYFQLHEAYRR